MPRLSLTHTARPWRLLAALMALAWVLVGCEVQTLAAPPAVQGVVDLRDWDAAEPVRLDGEWMIAWRALDPPDAPPSASVPIRVPSHWDDGGPAEDNRGYGTYHLRILLPPDPPQLSVMVRSIAGAGQVWIDGQPLPPQGVVSDNPAEIREDLRSVYRAFTPEGPEARLVIQVANERHRASGIRRPVLLGPTPAIDGILRRELLLDTAILVTLLTLGAAFLTLYAHWRRRREYLYVGLFYGSLALRVYVNGVSDPWLLLTEGLPWAWRMRTEYISMPLGAFLAISFVAYMCGVAREGWVHALRASTLVLAVITVFTPFKYFDLLLFLGNVCIAITLFFAVWQYWLASRRGDEAARLLLLSLPVMGVAMLVDQLAYTGVLPSQREFSPAAFLGFVMAMAWILMRRSATSFRRNEALTAELTRTHEAVLRFVPFPFLDLLDRRTIVEVQRGDAVRLDMDILFCDLRGFTTLAEALDRDEVFHFINRYLSYMEPPVLEHRGFVCQYYGDGILALFDAGADEAVAAGVAMARALEQYNREADGPQLAAGIGVSSGAVTLGIVGGSTRLDGNAVGDPVNQASRVEGMTRMYGSVLIIDEPTRARLQHPERYAMRELDRVTTKGRVTPSSIYEVLDALDEPVRSRRIAASERFAQARALYNEGRFEGARDGFRDCLEMDPGDEAAELFRGRCEQLIAEGAPEGWRGVWSWLEK